MPKITKEEKNNLQSTLHVDIAREDYQPEFEKKLKEYRNKVALKGFRKGKIPLSVLKKMFGKSVLVEVVNDMLSKQLNEFLKQADNNFLGQPIPTADQAEIDFDPHNLKDFRFSFDIGQAPEFEVQGLSKEKTFTYYMPELTDEMVRQELQRLREARANMQRVEGDYQDDDILLFQLKKGGNEQEATSTHKFSIHFKDVAPLYREQLSTLKPGDTLEVDNAYDFAPGWSEQEVDRRILNWQPDKEDKTPADKPSPRILLVFDGAERRVPAKLNQEFFDQVFGPDKVHNEDEALEVLREDLRAFYEGRSDTALYRAIHDYLMELHNEQTLPLPDDFLKRWLKESSEKNTEEQIEKGYADFARNLRWSLIKSKLAKKYNVEVKSEDIINHLRLRVQQMLQSYGLNDPRFINQMVQRLLQDEKEVERTADELLEIKLLEPLKKEFTLEEKVVPLDTFEALIKPPQAESPEEVAAKTAAQAAAQLEEE